MQGDARRCAVKSPMCDDEPTRSIGFVITLWPTASMFYTSVEDFSTKLRRNLDFAAILCSGDGDGRCSADKGAQNGDRGWSVPKAHSTDTPERSENSGARRE